MLALMCTVLVPTIGANAAEAEYINKYTPAKRICGYAKDENGIPLANTTVYSGFYDSRYSIPASNEYIEGNYTAVQTDSNGYYSFLAYSSGYYVVYLSANNVRAITYAYVRN